MRKPDLFWQGVNNIYFQDIIARILRMRSIKFAFLPPLSFYFNVGIRNYLAKFSLKKVALILNMICKRKLFETAG
jgi:hypothetical protein